MARARRRRAGSGRQHAILKCLAELHPEGAGADIWGTTDAFQFAYTAPLDINETVMARVSSEDGSNPFAKPGVMFRNGLGPDAAFVMLDVKPDGTLEFMARTFDGDAVVYLGTGHISFGSASYIRLVGAAPTVTASYSNDNGASWTTIGSAEPHYFPASLVVGLVVCSHDESALNTAVFENVSAFAN